MVIGGAVGLCLAIPIIWAATRGGETPQTQTRLPVDAPRALLGVAAAVIAAVAGYESLADQSLSLPEVGPLFAGLAGVALVASLYPARGVWSVGRRTVVAAVACIWVALAAATWPFAIAIPGCACTSSVPPPLLLGIGSRSWIIIAYAAGPLLLAIAASRIPDRARLFAHR